MAISLWDERFGGDDYFYGTRPNAFLVEQAYRLWPGARVLVPGDGEGRNGVWLAEQGLDVLSIDGSAVGSAKALRLASDRGVSIAVETADLTRWTWPTDRFDVVVSLFLHLPPAERAFVHARLVAALRPGGFIILEAFRPEQLAFSSGGPKDMSLLYTKKQLKADFGRTNILLLEEVIVDLDEGPVHRGKAATIRMVCTTEMTPNRN